MDFMVYMTYSSSSIEITPKGHEDGVEDSSRIIKQIGDPGVVTNIVKLPGCALLTERTHAHTVNIIVLFKNLFHNFHTFQSGLHTPP